MGLQQQAASQDTVDFADYLKPSTQYHQVHESRAIAQSQVEQKSPHRDHNTSFTSTKGLLNGPGQNNCFLNSAVQIQKITIKRIFCDKKEYKKFEKKKLSPNSLVIP
ncbi:hypothetical protein KPH14_008900 [Odynerus spinipes]|uniref:Uncharacterized protein n=1 Tax=Odynerus spinipes TaxID=1348599 RepID=A0AAD9VQ28_9HYME|nr:hypothetical protein KPH14_008900 [Odynerus spinipes]